MILDISATGRTGAARAANVESLFDAVILTRRSLYCACLRILEAVGSPLRPSAPSRCKPFCSDLFGLAYFYLDRLRMPFGGRGRGLASTRQGCAGRWVPSDGTRLKRLLRRRLRPRRFRPPLLPPPRQRLRLLREPRPDPQRLEGAQRSSDRPPRRHATRDEVRAVNRQLGFGLVGEKPVGDGESRVQRERLGLGLREHERVA